MTFKSPFQLEVFSAFMILSNISNTYIADLTWNYRTMKKDQGIKGVRKKKKRIASSELQIEK